MDWVMPCAGLRWGRCLTCHSKTDEWSATSSGVVPCERTPVEWGQDFDGAERKGLVLAPCIRACRLVHAAEYRGISAEKWQRAFFRPVAADHVWRSNLTNAAVEMTGTPWYSLASKSAAPVKKYCG